MGNKNEYEVRIEDLAVDHAISIAVLPRQEDPAQEDMTSFILHFQGRSLEDNLYVSSSLTVAKAIIGLFSMSVAGEYDRNMKSFSKRHEKNLRTFLSHEYDRFKSAFDQYETHRRNEMNRLKQSTIAQNADLDSQRFEPEEQVRYLSLNERDWINAVVVREDPEHRRVILKNESGNFGVIPRRIRGHQFDEGKGNRNNG